MKKIWEEKNKECHISPYEICRDYEDYIRQLEQLRLPLDKHNRFPSNFDHTHEVMSELVREKEDEIKKADLKRKNRILKGIVKRLSELYRAEHSEFEIVWPMSKKDFEKEGQLQHNCVSGYFEKIIKGQTVVFFLRKKEDIDKPFCTVEFKGEKLIQCRTIYNGGAPEEAMKYMDKISKNYMKLIEKQQKAAG